MTDGARSLVLNVDDYAPGRYARTQVLRGAGFDVAEAASGGETLSLASRCEPALVVLDVNLPDMSGYDVCRRLKADPRTAMTPVIQVSATFTHGSDRATGLEAGADAYLTEPLEPRVLLATVGTLLRTRQALVEAEKARAEAEAARADAERARADAEAARADAEATNRSKDEFIAMLSHELRGPLNTLVGWTRLLASGRLEPWRESRALDALARSIQALTRLTDDLLDVSRIVNGKLPLDVRPLDLGAVIAAAIDGVRDAADAKGVVIGTSIDSEATAVAGDAHRLQQVVWNLLSNAVKFTAPEGRVDVRLENHGQEVAIVVADTGIGIAPEFLPHVFERFQQAESGELRHGGLGLGLAIVRHLVEAHGGHVHAHSEGAGQGAAFTVVLRRDVAAPRAA
ncbi:MAG: hybrid sensor histidine kinase/response regulator [Candidatus Rokubacteria bacterium]|nr:hybrid sensor histidine kinase/response regulator [Candidatus Rokubacteria bacterium]